MTKKDIFADAINLQLEAKKIGLDWIDIEGIISKIYEETKEVEEAIQSNENKKIREELGDLLFTYISLARHLDINLHQVIEEAELKFNTRFLKIKSGTFRASPFNFTKASFDSLLTSFVLLESTIVSLFKRLYIFGRNIKPKITAIIMELIVRFFFTSY